MKKAILLVLMVILCFSLAACVDNEAIVLIPPIDETPILPIIEHKEEAVIFEPELIIENITEYEILTDNEISELARQIIYGDMIDIFNEFNEAQDIEKIATEQLFEAESVTYDKSSTEYIYFVINLLEKAMNFVDSKHRVNVLSMAVLFGNENPSFIESIDTMYISMVNELKEIESELSTLISADDFQRLSELHEQISTLTDGIFEAERATEALLG
jgi:hypothetical protein